MPASVLRSLCRDRRGVVSFYFIFTATALVMFIFAALDFMRVAMLRSEAQQAVDFAVLAAGRNLAAADKDWQQEAVDYFNLNILAHHLGVTASAPVWSPVTTGADGAEHVSLSIEVQIPLMTLGMTSLSTVHFTATSQARKRTRANVEMVMALDNTGSMAGTKLSSMKTAAQNVVTTMLGASSGGNTVVGLVPFNEIVNLSRYAGAWLDPNNPPAYPVAQWRGCLRERKQNGLYALDARPPTAQPFQAYGVSRYWQTGQWVNFHYVYSDHWENVYTDPSNFDYQSGCPAAGALFLTADQTTLNNAITAMTANGSTMVASGMVWGWRMLSPDWRGSWGDPARPVDKANDQFKVVVLLTDGDNEMAGTGTGYTDKSGRFHDDGKYYFYGPFDNTRAVPLHSGAAWNLAGLRNSHANDLLWNTLKATDGSYVPSVCAAAKADGVIIYTIPFGSGTSTSTDALLQGCASDPSKYLKATDSTSLQEAFRTITNSLSELVVEK